MSHHEKRQIISDCSEQPVKKNRLDNDRYDQLYYCHNKLLKELNQIVMEMKWTIDNLNHDSELQFRLLIAKLSDINQNFCKHQYVTDNFTFNQHKPDQICLKCGRITCG